MSGMSTLANTNICDYNARTALIEVTGLCRQSVMKTSHYQLKVPYNRLSQTIQNISRMGGKVTKVNILPTSSLTSLKVDPNPQPNSDRKVESKKEPIISAKVLFKGKK